MKEDGFLLLNKRGIARWKKKTQTRWTCSLRARFYPSISTEAFRPRANSWPVSRRRLSTVAGSDRAKQCPGVRRCGSGGWSIPREGQGKGKAVRAARTVRGYVDQDPRYVAVRSNDEHADRCEAGGGLNLLSQWNEWPLQKLCWSFEFAIRS